RRGRRRSEDGPADRPGDRRVRDAEVGHRRLRREDGGAAHHVATKIGPIAKPANIVFTPELPKTRSGKIMRRLLRDVAENRPLGDTTTLADPAVVDEIQDRSVSEPTEEG